jgi:hypothetical protein
VARRKRLSGRHYSCCRGVAAFAGHTLYGRCRRHRCHPGISAPTVTPTLKRHSEAPNSSRSGSQKATLRIGQHQGVMDVQARKPKSHDRGDENESSASTMNYWRHQPIGIRAHIPPPLEESVHHKAHTRISIRSRRTICRALLWARHRWRSAHGLGGASVRRTLDHRLTLETVTSS